MNVGFQTQRDSLKVVKEQMRQTQEEEMNSMIAETEQLQSLLDEARKKTDEKAVEVQQLKETLNKSENIVFVSERFKASDKN